MDKIYIRDLALRCLIGVYPEERHEKQDVLLNITLECDQRAASRSDRLEDAVDYKHIKQRVRDMVEASQYQLIESLAQKVSEICLENTKVHSVTVTVDKPSALRFARSVAVEITRARPPASS
ncbi:MAG: dihydroneopterin aldolase [Lentisphaerota bacterium]